MIRMGIIGTGTSVSIADWHTQGILKDERACISAVYNRGHQTTQRWKSRFSLDDAAACATVDELLELCDAVVICTPNRTHFQYAISALKAGKHVLLEKPMTLCPDEAQQLVRAARESGTYCCVGYTYRFTQAVDQLRDLVRNHIGPVYTIQASLGGTRLADPGIGMDWRMNQRLSGAGALGDFGSHLIDLAYFVTGERYSQVFCQRDISIKEREGEKGKEQVETDDSATLSLRGTCGLGSFFVSRVGLDALRVHIAGEGGRARLIFGDEPQLYYWEKERGGSYTGNQRELSLKHETPFKDWFQWEIQDFLDGIQGKPVRGASFLEGYYVEQVLSAAQDAAEDGNSKQIEKEELKP